MALTTRIAILSALALTVLALILNPEWLQFSSFIFLKAHYQQVQELYQRQPWLVLLIFMFGNTLVYAVSLPGASILAPLAGALFGLVNGTAVICASATAGATLAFMLTRYVFRASVTRKHGELARRFNAHIEKDGAYYLFAIRLNPLLPFFLINAIMGLTEMPLWTYTWISFLGTLPASLLYVNAGTQLARLNSLNEVLSWRVLVSLALLGLLPLALKKGQALLNKPD